MSLGGDSILSERGTFECIFNSIVDSGNLEDFTVWTITGSIVDLEHGCIGKSNLATNTTLKRLSFQSLAELQDFNDDFTNVTIVDDAVCEFAFALRQNTGLQSIDLDCRMMTNVGRHALLHSLRDNCSLTELTTSSTNLGELNFNDMVDLLGCGDIRYMYRLQSEIDHHMKLNKFWTRIQKFPFMDTKTKGVTKTMRKRINTISVQIYPDVIKVLATKPLLLYQFLLNDIDHAQLFGDDGGKPPQRRRSARVRKKTSIGQTTADVAFVAQDPILTLFCYSKGKECSFFLGSIHNFYGHTP